MTSKFGYVLMGMAAFFIGFLISRTFIKGDNNNTPQPEKQKNVALQYERYTVNGDGYVTFTLPDGTRCVVTEYRSNIACSFNTSQDKSQ